MFTFLPTFLRVTIIVFSRLLLYLLLVHTSESCLFPSNFPLILLDTALNETSAINFCSLSYLFWVQKITETNTSHQILGMQ